MQQPNSYDFKQDYGPSSTNTPQILEVNYVYELPFFKEQHGLEGKCWAAGNLRSFILRLRLLVYCHQTYDPSQQSVPTVGHGTGRGIGMRPNQIARVQMSKTRCNGSQPLPLRRQRNFGSEHSGSLLGPGVQNWDMATMKNVNLGEHFRFQLRGEFFNAFNHTNFDSVDSSHGRRQASDRSPLRTNRASSSLAQSSTSEAPIPMPHKAKAGVKAPAFAFLLSIEYP